MLVLKTTGTKTTPFKNQAYFADFNWLSFIPGDLVHLSNYRASDCAKLVGIFQKLENDNPVIRVLPRPYELILARQEIENVNEMADTQFWGRFINA